MLFLFADEKQTCARPLTHKAKMSKRVKLRHVNSICVYVYNGHTHM